MAGAMDNYPANGVELEGAASLDHGGPNAFETPAPAPKKSKVSSRARPGRKKRRKVRASDRPTGKKRPSRKSVPPKVAIKPHCRGRGGQLEECYQKERSEAPTSYQFYRHNLP